MVKAKVVYEGDLRAQCIHESGARIESDAPKDIGGKGEFFSPTDLLATGLAGCMLISMALSARKAGVELKGITADVEKEMASAPHRRIGKIVVRIRSELSLSAQIREKIEQAALHCPAHHSLHPDIKLEIDFIWGL
jgi:uncharacterized OsmC-like protein